MIPPEISFVFKELSITVPSFTDNPCDKRKCQKLYDTLVGKHLVNYHIITNYSTKYIN